MAQRQIATSTTSAVTDGSQVSFSLHPKLFDGGRSPIVSVKGLAGAETISFWLRVNDTWEEVTDESGVQQGFNVTRAADTFNAPGVYGYTKTVTVSPIYLYVTDSR